ncbi:hypothetical protein [Selenomonas noxia]|uniref:hypothetical protein n=1 Tax=Selenomonas noxia TaxID=135083 RepID=UPI0028E788AB|nr:hypothetical protein [Selenomonas noxia]
MTPWSICREIVDGILPMWRACRTVGGVMEMDPRTFGTQVEAQQRARELNAKGKKGEGDK